MILPLLLVVLRQDSPPEIILSERQKVYSPLQEVTLAVWQPGRIKVKDGAGKVYIDQPVTRTLSFTAAGALGRHEAVVEDAEGKPKGTATFEVTAKTSIRDVTGGWEDLLEKLRAAKPEGSRWISGFSRANLSRLMTSQTPEGAVPGMTAWEFVFLLDRAATEGVDSKPLAEAGRKALDSVEKSPLLWSSQRNLVKRQQAEPAPAQITLEDNVGFASACQKLSILLTEAGMAEDAARYKKKSDDHWSSLRRFFTVQGRLAESSEESAERAASADLISSVHPWALDKGLTRDEAVGVIDFFQGLKRLKPAAAWAEWITPYPAGAAIQINNEAAGQLAKSAFLVGREKYGADILDRLKSLLASRTPSVSGWKIVPESSLAAKQFVPISLGPIVNRGLALPEAPQVSLDGLPQGTVQIADVPWEIVKPAESQGRAVLALSYRAGFERSASILVGQRASLVHLLSLSLPAEPGVLNDRFVSLSYSDGSERVVRVDSKNVRPGWKGEKASLETSYVINPFPERTIRSIGFLAPFNEDVWVVAGLTVSDGTGSAAQEVRPYSESGSGAASAVTDALIEGLAGIQTEGRGFGSVSLSPRWAAAGVDRIWVTGKTETGYLSYDYRHDPSGKKITLLCSSSASGWSLRPLMPSGAAKVTGIKVNGVGVKLEQEQVGDSIYALAKVTDLQGSVTIEIGYN